MKRSQKYYLYSLFYMTFILSIDSLAAIKKQQLEAHLTRQIQAILDTSQLLHQSLIRNENDQVAIHLSHIERLVILAKRISYNSNTNTLHLRHILNNVQKAIEQAGLYIQEGQRKQEIKKIFSQLVLVAQTYQLDFRYPVYFCDKDRSVWLQKSGQIRNPIHPHYTYCGTIVN